MAAQDERDYILEQERCLGGIITAQQIHLKSQATETQKQRRNQRQNQTNFQESDNHAPEQ